jgi:hypothetical protein
VLILALMIYPFAQTMLIGAAVIPLSTVSQTLDAPSPSW